MKEISAIVRAAVRATDLVARYGGEEIVVLLEGRDEHSALQVAAIVRKRIERVFAAENDNVRVTASLGAATTSAQLRDLPVVMRLADEALYAAKRNGRNRVELAPPG
ncbi:GGDEF domain-containing protein [Sinorhizobium fredii]|uniref:GGDEF domain-containing protein n=1 Tax=Rhizobium fredii TaxID=380 RepID=UPI003470C95F